MSDIRAQARRDAEFERLLAEMKRDHIAALFDSLSQNFSGAVLSWERDAIEGLVDGLIEKIGARCYETGKRHGREVAS